MLRSHDVNVKRRAGLLDRRASPLAQSLNWLQLGFPRHRVVSREHLRMVSLVRIALTRPYTFVVMALLLLIVGPLAALRTPTDIFPDIRIPVISVVAVHGPAARPDGRPHLHAVRARADHYRQ
jgi:hypothetical protein